MTARRRQLATVLAVGATAAACTYVVNGTLLRSSPPRQQITFDILEHKPSHLLGAGGQKVGWLIPAARYPGAQIFASRPATGRVCVTDRAPDGSFVAACGPPDEASVNGVGLLRSSGKPHAPLRYTALVPNGVRDVEYIHGNGIATTIPVTNNVASYIAPDLKFVRFVRPDGTARLVKVVIPSGI